MIEHRMNAPRTAALLAVTAVALSVTACKKADSASADRRKSRPCSSDPST